MKSWFAMLLLPIAVGGCHKSNAAPPPVASEAVTPDDGKWSAPPGDAFAALMGDGNGGDSIRVAIFPAGSKATCKWMKRIKQLAGDPSLTTLTTLRNFHSDEDYANLMWQSGGKIGKVELKVDYQFQGEKLQRLDFAAPNAGQKMFSARVCSWGST